MCWFFCFTRFASLSKVPGACFWLCSMNVFTAFRNPSKVQLHAFDFVNVLTGFSSTSTVPSACLWFCGMSLLTSPCKVPRCPKCFFVFAAPFGFCRIKLVGFSSNKSLYNIKVGGPLHLLYKIKVKTKLLWNLKQALEIFRANSPRNPRASFQFQKPSALELIK